MLGEYNRLGVKHLNEKWLIMPKLSMLVPCNSNFYFWRLVKICEKFVEKLENNVWKIEINLLKKTIQMYKYWLKDIDTETNKARLRRNLLRKLLNWSINQDIADSKPRYEMFYDREGYNQRVHFESDRLESICKDVRYYNRWFYENQRNDIFYYLTDRNAYFKRFRVFRLLRFEILFQQRLKNDHVFNCIFGYTIKRFFRGSNNNNSDELKSQLHVCLEYFGYPKIRLQTGWQKVVNVFNGDYLEIFVKTQRKVSKNDKKTHRKIIRFLEIGRFNPRIPTPKISHRQYHWHIGDSMDEVHRWKRHSRQTKQKYQRKSGYVHPYSPEARRNVNRNQFNKYIAKCEKRYVYWCCMCTDRMVMVRQGKRN